MFDFNWLNCFEESSSKKKYDHHVPFGHHSVASIVSDSEA